MVKTNKLMAVIFILATFLSSCSKEDNEPTEGFTGNSGSFVDARDGRTYKWVKIGEQIWMAENLAYNVGNGCWAYEYNNGYEQTYGRLYTWAAAKAASPDGWHLPTDAEWEQMAEFISAEHGGITKQDDDWRYLGTMLRSRSGWANDGNGTDDYGFNALPAGARSGGYDEFWGIGERCDWWTATPADHFDNGAYLRGMLYWENLLAREEESEGFGISVRCVKD